MVKISVTIANEASFKSAFLSAPQIMLPYLRNASMDSALLIEGAGKKLSPVDTGRMRASIGTSLGVLDKGLTSVVQTNVFYAVFVHEGTSRIKARPFMRQAAEQNMQRIGNIYSREIGRAMDELAKQAS